MATTPEVPSESPEETIVQPAHTARTLRRKRRAMPKGLGLWIATIVVVLVAAYFVWQAIHPATSATNYVTTTVSRGTLTVSASGNGSLVVERASSVSPQVSGVVSGLGVSLGEKVAAGQKLFDVVNDSLDNQVSQQLASYRQAKSSYERAEQSQIQANQSVTQAQLQLEQAQQAQSAQWLKQRSHPASVTTAQLSNARRQVSIAEQGLEAAQEGVGVAETGLSAASASKNSALQSYDLSVANANKRSVTSPISGVVTAVNIQDGDSISGGGSSSAGGQGSSSSSGSGSGAALVISDLGTLQAKVAISELDRSNVKIGQKATLTFDALPNLTLTGKVTSLDAVGTNTQGVVTYSVVITLDTLDKRLSPGMTVAAAITTQVRTDVLSVPRAAVKSDSSGTYVLVLPSGATTAQRVTVTTGVSTDTSIEITSGLKEGDVVVTQSITAGSTTSTTGTSRGGGGFGILGGGAGRAIGGAARGGN
jgi:multidrug efflux pump subunit AcrA (membrane-fusion protein)